MTNFAGPTKKMMKALEDEGLMVDWPAGCPTDGEELAMDGYFCIGADRRASLFIDLRGKDGLGRKSRVDSLVAEELAEERDNFDIDEEFEQGMNMSGLGRAAEGKPTPSELWSDLKEEKALLERFAEVAEAVAGGRPIPSKEKPIVDGEPVHITAGDASAIIDYLWVAYPSYNNLGKCEVSGLIKRLCQKTGRKCRFRFV